jgi:hypothetical protein
MLLPCLISQEIEEEREKEGGAGKGASYGERRGGGIPRWQLEGGSRKHAS